MNTHCQSYEKNANCQFNLGYQEDVVDITKKNIALLRPILLQQTIQDSCINAKNLLPKLSMRLNVFSAIMTLSGAIGYIFFNLHSMMLLSFSIALVGYLLTILMMILSQFQSTNYIDTLAQQLIEKDKVAKEELNNMIPFIQEQAKVMDEQAQPTLRKKEDVEKLKDWHVVNDTNTLFLYSNVAYNNNNNNLIDELTVLIKDDKTIEEFVHIIMNDLKVILEDKLKELQQTDDTIVEPNIRVIKNYKQVKYHFVLQVKRWFKVFDCVDFNVVFNLHNPGYVLTEIKSEYLMTKLLELRNDKFPLLDGKLDCQVIAQFIKENLDHLFSEL